MNYLVWMIAFLVICSVLDIKERKVDLIFCFLNMGVALIIHIINRDNLIEVFCGILVGIFFGIICFITREAIGKGDAVIIATIGCIAGINVVIKVLVGAAMMCALFSIIGVILKRVKFKTRLPFVPFILLGGIVTLICG